MASAADSLRTAMQLHQTGQLLQAEKLYRQVLQADPTNADALHLLGLIAYQAGRHDPAIEQIQRAIAIDGRQHIYHNNLGEVYRSLGRVADARACYEKALWLESTFAAAHHNLGLVLSASDPAAAQHHYELAIRLQPEMVAARNNLGNLLRAQGKADEAISAYRSALRYQPNYVEAIGNLAAALIDLECFAEAIEELQHAVRLRPVAADLHFNLGNARKGVFDWEGAAACYEHALELRPDFDEARCNLANVAIVRGDSAAAEAAYREVLGRKPNHFEALLGFGTLLQGQGKMDEALEYFDRALTTNANSAIAHFNRGCVLASRYMRNESVAEFQEALRLQPNYPEAYARLAVIYNEAGQPDTALEFCRDGFELGSTSGTLFGNMAIALHAQGRAEEAIECYRKALALRPNNPVEHSNLLYALNFMSGYDPKKLFAEHVEWGQRHAEALTRGAAPHENDPSPDRRLRIGYVSPHFHEHAVNFFVEPILAAHDHEQFEVFCYSSVFQPDATTERLKRVADHWREVTWKSDAEIARMVREDRIDILVDLSGHMGRTRLLVFARKPAPVQVTYIGYQNTTGMSAIAYRLTDERADPPGVTDALYTEKLVRLSRAFFCYQPFETPDLTPLPALERGYVTFGSFNNYAKVMPEVVDTWLTILSRVPESHLMVLAYSGGYLEKHLKELAAGRGIDPVRVELFDKRWRQDYLKLVQQADIALDAFPFNGHTTTCDAIWMGVPVVMLEGNVYSSRFGGSVLANVGLEDLIARSVEEYVERAVELAGDLERLSTLRGELRTRMAASPLADYQGFTRNLEREYRRMWTDWCQRSSSPAASPPAATESS
jgi:predicted O-linked N-acetylglucosamine transferase (SPINDLY family)